MKAYGSAASPVLGTQHRSVPLPPRPVSRPEDDIVARLERSRFVSPIVLRDNGPDNPRPRRAVVPTPTRTAKTNAARHKPLRDLPSRPTLDVEALVAAYQRGVTIQELAARHGNAVTTIRRQLRNAGLVLRDGRRSPHKAEQRIVEAYQSGMSAPRIATMLGISKCTVRRVIFAAGIPARDDRRTFSGGGNRLPADLVDEVVADLRAGGLTYGAIAERRATSATTVARIAARHGLRRPTTPPASTGDNAEPLRALMAANGVASHQVRSWAAARGIDCPGHGIPPRRLIEDYLLDQHRPITATKGTPA